MRLLEGGGGKHSVLIHQMYTAHSPCSKIPVPFSGNPLYTLTLPHFPLTSLFNVSHSHSNATETRAPDYITALCQTQLHQLHTSDHQHARWQQAYVCCSRRSIVPMGFAHSGFTLHFILLTFLLLVLIFFKQHSDIQTLPLVVGRWD